MRDPVDWPTRDPLSHRADATPDRTAMIDAGSGERWTYRDLSARVDSLAATLERRAPIREARIGIVMNAGVAFPAVLFAAMRRGASVVPLNTRLTPGELGRQLDRVDPAVVVAGDDTAELARRATDREVVTVEGTDDWTHEDGTDPGSVRLDRGDEALVLFTSGTTGKPKAVRLTVGNLVASATASAFRLGVRPDDRWLACLPMYHMGGLAPVVRSVLYGTPLVVQRGFDATETARAIENHDVTGVSLVPTMLSRLLDDGWSPPDSLRFVLLGGAPASEELIDRGADRGVPVCPTYGATEAASQIATALPETAREHPGTVGQPLLFTDVAVVDPDGRACDPGEPGEIVVDGPTVSPGYLDDERTTVAFDGRGFHTGDVGYRDRDGRLWVTGRLDDRIVTGGENVDPAEVAGVIREHPRVADAAVVGLDDPEWGQRVAALVVPTDEGEPPTPGDVEGHCRERLAGFKIPRTVAFAANLPRTDSGTVDRDAVRERLRSGR